MVLKKSKAFVLKRFKYGESSIIATLFSLDDGMFSAIIKGARKPNSKFSGVFETLNNISVTFNKKENRDLQFITNAECINTFGKIKENLDKLQLAYSIVEAMIKSHYYYENNKDTYLLLDESLTNLNKFENNFGNILIYFLLFLSKCTGHFILDKYRFNETFDNHSSFKDIKKVINLLEEFSKTNIIKLEGYNIEDNLYDKTIQTLVNHLNENDLIPYHSKVERAISQMKLKKK